MLIEIYLICVLEIPLSFKNIKRFGLDRIILN